MARADLYRIQSMFKADAIVSITQLADLDTDFASQYVHVSINRTITAQHDFAPDAAQAPFTLGTNAQGQLVTGLNADQLDGNEATAFAAAAHTHPISAVTSLQTALDDIEMQRYLWQ